MPVETLDFAEPFFTIRWVTDTPEHAVGDRAILLNLGDAPLDIEDQSLAPLTSVIVQNTAVRGIERAVLIERFDAYPDVDALFAKIKEVWPSAWEVRREERLKGVSHFLSPKVRIGKIGLSMYHSGSVPLNVGLHKFHDFCPVPGFREVHTQVVGFGKMQQCREKDLDTLYLEEPMAPGTTHRPMFDAHGNYPWHQYDTITPSIFMAVEILPEGADWPA